VDRGRRKMMEEAKSGHKYWS